MSDTIRWGILGTGNIAKTFAKGLKVLPDAALVAVGSRSQETADAFGDSFSVPNRHPSYEELVADPEVDVVYIATPHPMHKDNSILCLKNGKAVLCEKPFTVNQADTQAVVDVARAEGLFLMEAMWTRFLPAIRQAVAWVEEGAIGEPRMLEADFGFRTDWEEACRLLDPALAGGALLDVGIYPIALAALFFGDAPAQVTGVAHLGDTGVDEQFAALIRFDAGQLAVLSGAVRTETPQRAVLSGTEGRIEFHTPFWCCDRLTLVPANGKLTQWHEKKVGNGYNYEAAAVMDCMRKGLLEHPWITLDESLKLMGIMDELRRQWGVKYPME